MLQIILTRIISVTSWYHLAFFIISIGMFGLTAGAVWVYLRREVYRQEFLSYHLTVSSLAFALSMLFALGMQLTLVTGVPASTMAFVVWALLAVALSLPFFFSGVVVSLALTRNPYPIGIVYGVDLVGAALGCLLVLALLNVTDGPAAVLWVAVLVAIAALLFSRSMIGRLPASPSAGSFLFHRRYAVAAILVIAAVANQVGGGAIRPTMVKNQMEEPHNIFFEGWNSFSRIVVFNTASDPPHLWGASPRLPPVRIDQRWMTIDGAAGTTVYRFGGKLDEVSFLRYDVTNLAYAIPQLRTGAVIGVGGGRDVMSARLMGVQDVVGVEINPIFIRLLSERMPDFNALARLPGVSFEVDEARSWFAGTDRRFDVIQMSLIDTWAATGAGAFTLSENGLYTVEGWRTFMERLEPNGVFTVSRWYAPGEVNETGRMVSLAVATLLEMGAEDPQSHMFLAAAGNVASIVISRSPLSEAALASLRKASSEYDFRILIAPHTQAASPLLQSISTARSRAALERATETSYLDLSPPTDSRPFFFNQLRIQQLFDPEVLAQAWRPGVFGGNLVATITLGFLIAISFLLVALTIVVPLGPTIRSAGAVPAIGGTLYFALIGAGFMLAEIALLQRMSVFLGHPVYALSVVLFSLILATGAGSLVSERFQLNTFGRVIGWSLLTGLYLLSMPLWLPAALASLESSSLFVRAALCVLVLGPAGFLMGFAFPTGMRIVSALDRTPTPWFWGINGAAGVLAASVAVLTSIAYGIDVTLTIGAICYLLLPAPALWLMRERGVRKIAVPA
ncbi:MAG: hypothetical protein Q8M31_01605 [Beijerinckiaceae bacterium]|nr:hypothetical protein [Beijerinckiaceae bacterium]